MKEREKMVSRRAFLKTAAVGGAALAAGEVFAGVPVKGRITAKGRPMSGVVVTDGRICVETADDGTWALPGREGVRFISVTVPSGWKLPQHYLKFEGPEKNYDFDLEPWAPSGRTTFCIHHVGDSEISASVGAEKDWIARAKKFSDERDCAFIVHTGDICTTTGDLHIQLMNGETMGRPVFYIVGNHDNTRPQYGAYAEEAFVKFYGPCWYSFDCCGVHFVATPMMWGDGKPTFTADEIVAWLRNDLAIAKRKNQPVMLLTHGLHDTFLYDMRELFQKSKVVTLNADPLDVTAACDLRAIIHGHLHVNYFRRTDDRKIEIVSVAPPQMGCTDCPPTLQVIHVDKNRRLRAENRFGHMLKWPVVTTAPAGGWIAKMNGPVVYGQPCVAGGRVFVGNLDWTGDDLGGIYAFSAKTGQKLWFFRTEFPMINRCEHWNDIVYAMDFGWMLYALNVKNGKVVWKRDLRRDIGMAGAMLSGGADAHTPSGITIDEGSGRLYVGTIMKALLAVDLKTGEPVWHTKSEGHFYLRTATAPVVGEGVVVGGGYWWGLYGYDAKTGEEIWKHCRNNSSVTEEWYRSGLPWLERVGIPLVVGGKLYLTSARDFLEVDLHTGELLRRKELGFSVNCYTQPLVHDGIAYFGSQNDGLIAFDLAKFEIAWKGAVENSMLVMLQYQRPPLKTVASIPVLWKGLVWVTASDGALYAWDPKTGERKERIFTGAPDTASATVSGNRLYVVDFTGRMRCFV